ncbi:MAG: GNAT family N-acetyltransferase, partial [Candidatus Methylumidiphilus sp.]
GMLIAKPTSWGRWALFLPAQAQIGAVLVKDAALLPKLFDALPGLAWSLECLCQDPQYSPIQIAQDFPPLLAVDHVRTMNIALDGSFADYWAGRSRNLRHNLGRYLRRKIAAGLTLSLRQIDSPDAMPTAVERYGRLESKGWKGQQGTAVHIDNAQGRFYCDMLTDFARRGKALVYEMHLGDSLAAMRLCILSDTMLIILKTAYDEDYAEYAPGRLLLHALLQQEFQVRRVSSIEFYTNANSDQLAWATDDRIIQHVQLFRSPTAKAAYAYAFEVHHTLLKRKDGGHLSLPPKIDAELPEH